MSRLQSLREALSHAPDNTALLLLYGHACLDELLLDEAQEIFTQILTNEPEHPEAQLCLARALVLQGDTSGAAVRVERILQRDPVNASAHLLLSRIHLTENQKAKALEHFQKAHEIDPTATDRALEVDLGRTKSSAPRERTANSPLDLLEDDDGPDIPQEFFDDPFDEPINSEWRPETFFAPGDNERFRVNFAEVGGMEALKEEIRLKIIYPLQHAELYKAYGKKTGGGILLYGPPGCGKTFIAKATAGEMNARVFSVGLSDILDIWMGKSEKKLHQIFEMARQNTPCVLFFDEIDALGASRSDMKQSSGRNIINQFLQELDGIDQNNEGILVLGATNTPWHLDTAFRRPGRFDRIIFV